MAYVSTGVLIVEIIARLDGGVTVLDFFHERAGTSNECLNLFARGRTILLLAGVLAHAPTAQLFHKATFHEALISHLSIQFKRSLGLH